MDFKKQFEDCLRQGVSIEELAASVADALNAAQEKEEKQTQRLNDARRVVDAINLYFTEHCGAEKVFALADEDAADALDWMYSITETYYNLVGYFTDEDKANSAEKLLAFVKLLAKSKG